MDTIFVSRLFYAAPHQIDMPETSMDKNHVDVGDEALRDIVLDWRALKSKRQKRRKFKDYQEQLLKVLMIANKLIDLAKTKFMITTNKV